MQTEQLLTVPAWVVTSSSNLLYPFPPPIFASQFKPYIAYDHEYENDRDQHADRDNESFHLTGIAFATLQSPLGSISAECVADAREPRSPREAMIWADDQRTAAHNWLGLAFIAVQA